MYKFTVSVRADNIGRKHQYDFTTAAGCIAAANDLLTHPCSGAGKGTITELFRAGGLGVYQIAARLSKNPEEVRVRCERLDYALHEKWI